MAATVTTRPKGLLNIPELEQPTRDSFNVRPKHINAWLNELPMGDKGECARQIFHTLKEINRLDISNRDRWRSLELIVVPLTEMTNSLEQHFCNQSIPIAEKNLKIADLCIELYRECALGYKILLDQIWTKNLTFLNKNDAVRIIYRAMYYLHKVLLTTYEIYNDPPPNSWIHIHQLYLYADDNQLGKITPRNINPHTPRLKTSINDLYIQIILLGLLSPFRLRQIDTKKVTRALEDWSKHCKISDANQFEETSGHVLIKQNSDYAPGYHFVDKSINHNYTRTLDSSALISHISDLVVSQPAHIDQNSKIYDLPADVIKLIIVTWSGKSRRLFSRTAEQNKLTVSIGINATHFMVSNMQKLQPELIENSPFAALTKSISEEQHQQYLNLQNKGELQFESDSNFEAAPAFGITGINKKSADVWDHDYSSKTLGQSYNLQIWQESKESSNKTDTNYQAINFDNINESANGYCLFSNLGHESNPTKVQVGELIGIRSNQDKKKQDTIDLGIIRRLKSTENGIELGIQKLAPSADVVAICLYRNRNSDKLKFQRALLLPTLKPINQATTLIVGKTLKSGSDLVINKFGIRMRIQLTKIVETTGEFNQFEFEIKDTLDPDTAEPAKDKDTKKDFSSVWELI